MNCPKCERQLARKTGDYQYRECGLENVWLQDWPLFVCDDCGLQFPLMPGDPRIVTSDIARQLILTTQTPLQGDAVLFLREALGLTSQALATLLDVSRVEVSRWENDAVSISAYSDFKLRLFVIDQVLPVEERKDVKEQVVLIFQHRYRPKSHEATTVSVPASAQLLSSV